MALSLDKALGITVQALEPGTDHAQLPATNMADAISNTIGMGSARPLDATSALVQAPRNTGQQVSAVSVLENFTLEPGVSPGKRIINSGAGTVAIGAHVRVTAASLSHRNLTVTISERLNIGQPRPLSVGNTVVVSTTDVKVTQETSHMFLFPTGGEPGQDCAPRQSTGRWRSTIWSRFLRPCMRLGHCAPNS